MFFLKKYFEKVYDGKLFYFLLKILIFLLELNKSFLYELSQAKIFRIRASIRILKLNYKINFKKLNFKEAYRSKIEFILASYDQPDLFSRESLDNYLSIINQKDFLEALEIKKEEINQINSHSKEIDFPFLKNKIDLNNILYIGPASKEEDLKLLNSFDLIVFNKPLNQKVEIDSAKIMMVLNNIFSIEKKKEILKWLEANQNAKIVSPQNISEDLKADPFFNLLPTFPECSSLMGLQRSLLAINYFYNYQKLEIKGFDFSLSQKPYNDWYPSIMRDSKKNDFSSRIIQSNFEHDLAFNILFVRKFSSKYPNLKGKVIDISKLNIMENLILFKNIHG
tara:strand:- start:734 stop:1744 length:1011 start_codon:yes stop_codon:yes gene_type:complete